MVALLLGLHDGGHGPYAVMALLICFALPIVLTMGLAGGVADRHDPRRVLVVALAVQALGALGLVLAPSPLWTCVGVLVIRGLLAGIAVVPLLQVGQGLSPTIGAYAVTAFGVGLTLGFVNALVFALLLREVPDGDRGKVISLVSGLSRTATIGALAVGGVLGTQVGARTAYVVCGCVGVLIAATAALRVRRSSRRWASEVHRTVDHVSTHR